MFEDSVGKNVLEVGCGRAPFTPYFHRKTETYLGVDESEKAIDWARDRYGDLEPEVEFERVDVTGEAFRKLLDERDFDTVVCLNVLEHLEDDRGLLRKIRETLTSADKLILQVPAHPVLFGTNDASVGHHRRYTRSGLRALLDDVNFRSEWIRYFNMAGVVPWFVEGRILRRRGGHFENSTSAGLSFRNAVVPLLRILEEVVEPPFGISLFAAVRPKETS